MTSVGLKLRAENETEDRIMDYLLENASEALVEKINVGNKTLAGALRYCNAQAQKQAHNGVACIEDATVFAWVIHYFEEASLDEEEKPKASPPAATSPAPSNKPARRPRAPRKAKPEAEAPAPMPEPAQAASEGRSPDPLEKPAAAAQPDLFGAAQEKGGMPF